MKQEQYKEWAKKREKHKTMYSRHCDFQSTIDNLPKPSNSTELNPSIHRVGLVGDILTGKADDTYYARTNHVNFIQLEEALKQIEVGRLAHPEYFGCKVFGSGMAAIKSTLEGIAAGQDGVFIHGNVIYPSTKTILADQGNGRNMVGTKPGIGVDLRNPGELKRTIQTIQNKGDNVLGVIMEPISNPTIAYTDTRKVSNTAHQYDIPLIVDNTFLTPYLQEPFRMGADIVVHSLTKYFSGQGDMTGGAVIMPKEFEGDIQNVRRHGGPIMSIRDAYEFARRVPTVGQRALKHSQNAQTLNKELRDIDGIKVSYNDLSEQTRDGYAGGVLSFEFDGDAESAYLKARNLSQYIIDNPEVAEHRVSLAEPKTLILPYAGLADMNLIQSIGIPTGLVRIATGREDNYSEKAQQIKEAVEGVC